MPKLVAHYKDPVHIKITEGAHLVNTHIAITKERWQEGQYGQKIKTTKRVSQIDHWGNCLAGFLPRIAQHCEYLGVPFVIENPLGHLLPSDEPEASGITFRPYQKDIVNTCITNQRGVVFAATAAGKTVIIIGIATCFPLTRILLLCHTKEIAGQTHKRFLAQGFKQVALLQEGQKEFTGSQVVIATRQTFIKIPRAQYASYFDIVFVDEGHHISSFKGEYPAILGSCMAPMRFAFTGTLPDTEEGKLALEGFIGPVIATYSVEDGIAQGFLAKPIIKWISVPWNENIAENKTYKGLISAAVVHNRARNRALIKKALEQKAAGESCLILVDQIAHGNNLVEMASDIFDEDIPFVQGATDSDTRAETKAWLSEKKEKIVICTSVWREGVDLPSLDNVFLATTHKSSIQVQQAIGRGLRKAEGKDTVTIWDFLDPYRYLAEHCVARIQIYVEKGWI